MKLQDIILLVNLLVNNLGLQYTHFTFNTNQNHDFNDIETVQWVSFVENGTQLNCHQNLIITNQVDEPFENFDDSCIVLTPENKVSIIPRLDSNIFTYKSIGGGEYVIGEVYGLQNGSFSRYSRSLLKSELFRFNPKNETLDWMYAGKFNQNNPMNLKA